MDIIDNFIYQHFTGIKSQILFGPDKSKRAYLNQAEFGYNYRNWTFVPTETEDEFNRNIHKTIHLFFELCLNTSQRISVKGKKPFEGVSAKINKSLYLSCLQQKSLLTSEIYENYIGFSDQMIKFIFYCVGLEPNKKGTTFDNRITIFEQKLEQASDSLKPVVSLLKAMQRVRNQGAHEALVFSSDRAAWLNRITYMLYDYITVMYIIKYVIKEENNQTSLFKEADTKSASATSLDIRFEINLVNSKKNDCRLYLYPGNAKQDDDVCLYKQIPLNNNGYYTVQRFKSYVLTVNGNKSNPFKIDHTFSNACCLQVQVPPFPQMENPVLEIIDIYNLNYLPPEVLYLIDEVEKKIPKNNSQFAGIIKNLVISSFNPSLNESHYIEIALTDLKASIINASSETDLIDVLDSKVRQHLDNDVRKSNLTELKSLHCKIKNILETLNKSNNLSDEDHANTMQIIENVTKTSLNTSEIKDIDPSCGTTVNSADMIDRLEKILSSTSESQLNSDSTSDKIKDILGDSEIQRIESSFHLELYSHSKRLMEFNDYTTDVDSFDLFHQVAIQKGINRSILYKTLELQLIYNISSSLRACIHSEGIIIHFLNKLARDSHHVISPANYAKFQTAISDLVKFINNTKQYNNISYFHFIKCKDKLLIHSLREVYQRFIDSLLLFSSTCERDSIGVMDLNWMKDHMDMVLSLDDDHIFNFVPMIYSVISTPSYKADILSTIIIEAPTDSSSALFDSYNNLKKELQSLTTVFEKSLINNYNRQYCHLNGDITVLIERIHSIFNNNIPCEIKDVLEADDTCISTQLRHILLKKYSCLAKYPLNDLSLVEFLNNIDLSLGTFESFLDMRTPDYLHQDLFIRPYVKKYLSQLMNSEVFDTLVKVAEPEFTLLGAPNLASAYCYRILRVALKLAHDEIMLEIIYKNNFNTDGSIKDHGMKISYFIANGYYRMFNDPITPDKTGYVNLKLAIQRMQRLKNWGKEELCDIKMSEALHIQLKHFGTFYAMEYFPRIAHREFKNIQASSKDDYKHLILNTIDELGLYYVYH